MIIKVCGMRQPENISAVDALDIDVMGFIMYPPSPRYFFQGVKSGVVYGMKTGLIHEADSELVNGLETGLVHKADSELVNGLKTGLVHGSDSRLVHGAVHELDSGLKCGLETRLESELKNELKPSSSKQFQQTRSKRAGVFVNETLDNILHIAQSLQLDIIQLHGNETPRLCRAIKEKGFKVTKVFSINCNEPSESAKRMFGQIEKDYEGMADFFLFDTKCEAYGGSGVQFDWDVLHHYNGHTPFFLSGGIDINSVSRLKEFHHEQWAGIDLNSGFEISPALKNIELLESFITEIRK